MNRAVEASEASERQIEIYAASFLWEVHSALDVVPPKKTPR